MPIKTSRSIRKRIGDLAIYLSVAVGIVMAILWFTPVNGNQGEIENIWKWIGLAGTTLVLFGYAVRANWRFACRRSFWFVVTALLTIHLAVFITVLNYSKTWKVLWFVALYPFENTIIDAILARTGHDVLSPDGRGEGDE